MFKTSMAISPTPAVFAPLLFAGDWVSALEAATDLGYDAIGLGRTDLRLPAGELVADAASLDGHPSPFVAANVALFGFDAKLTTQAKRRSRLPLARPTRRQS